MLDSPFLSSQKDKNPIPNGSGSPVAPRSSGVQHTGRTSSPSAHTADRSIVSPISQDQPTPRLAFRQACMAEIYTRQCLDLQQVDGAYNRRYSCSDNWFVEREICRADKQ
jgi:hypothetical protein